MSKFVDKVVRILENEFPGALVELKRGASSRRIGGFLTWSGFDGKDHVSRQEILQDALERALTREERSKMTMIFTATPEEVLVED
jgi:hypothetical protein